jgi:hypothetical protein
MLVCSLFSGCVQFARGPSIDWDAATAPRMQLNIMRDDLKELVTYEGPNCAPNPLSALLLRAVAGGGMPPAYGIYITDHYYDDVWRRYELATDSEGHSFLLHVLERRESYCDEYGCAKDERVMIGVSREYLGQYEGEGVRLQLEGRRGAAVYVLPGGYIGAFLRQVP